MSGMQFWGPIVVSALVALALGVGGAVLTGLGTWYRDLRKPSWQPPDWLFGPAWTTIFALAATAAVWSWWAAATQGEQARVILLFGVNAVLNLAWSWLFFNLRRPDWAFYEVLALWTSIVALMAGIWPLSQGATLLLLPYLAWVTFATVLNRAIVRLNAPFEPATA